MVKKRYVDLNLIMPGKPTFRSNEMTLSDALNAIEEAGRNLSPGDKIEIIIKED